MLHGIAGAVLTVLVLAGGVAAQEPPVCDEGVFVVEGRPLMPGSTSAVPDMVTLRDGKVAIASGCPAVPARIEVTPEGTFIRARWRECPGYAALVRLRARIEPTCRQMKGTIAARNPLFERRFVAAQCNDPATCLAAPCLRNADCRDTFYCAKRVGECEDRGVCRERPDACPDVVDPVCGCDGETYGNRCEAAAAGVSAQHRGRCAPACDPANPTQCGAGEFCQIPPGVCDSADVRGACTDIPQLCPDVYRPVCGCDGRTYGNRCEAAANSASIAHRGECRPLCGTIVGIPCPAGQYCELPPAMCSSADLAGQCLAIPEVCPHILDPVCGCDGETYPNDCARRQAQVALAHRGRCEPSTSNTP